MNFLEAIFFLFLLSSTLSSSSSSEYESESSFEISSSDFEFEDSYELADELLRLLDALNKFFLNLTPKNCEYFFGITYFYKFF